MTIETTAAVILQFMTKKEMRLHSVQFLLIMREIGVKQGIVGKREDADSCREKSKVSS